MRPTNPVARSAAALALASLMLAPVAAGETVLKEGTLEPRNELIHGAVGVQPITGSVAIVQRDDGRYALRLGPDFSVDSPPTMDVRLLFRADATDAEAALANTPAALAGVGGFVVGALQALSGAQEYALPEGFDPGDYNAVAIFCWEFSLNFGTATLH